MCQEMSEGNDSVEGSELVYVVVEKMVQHERGLTVMDGELLGVEIPVVAGPFDDEMTAGEACVDDSYVVMEFPRSWCDR